MANGRDGTGDRPTVIFLHIGKTAGSTMRDILHRNFRRSEIFEFKKPSRAGRPADWMPREATLERFAGLPESERSSYRLIEGHTIFGLHRLIPRPCSYFTLLRDPVALVLSQFAFVRQSPGHRLYDQVKAGLTLEEYVTSGITREVDNSQTRAISGDASTPFGGCTDEMVEQAKRNIEESFPVVGLTERFDETLILLRRAFGWSRLSYVRVNVSPQKTKTEVTPAVIAEIQRLNRQDIELHRWAVERFDRAVAADPSFAGELDRFRRQNARYRPFGMLRHGVPTRLRKWLARKTGGSAARDLTVRP